MSSVSDWNHEESTGFADPVKFILGDTGIPYDWEYGESAEEF